MGGGGERVGEGRDKIGKWTHGGGKRDMESDNDGIDGGDSEVK